MKRFLILCLILLAAVLWQNPNEFNPSPCSLTRIVDGTSASVVVVDLEEEPQDGVSNSG